jgi:hypothetical protein
MATITIPDEIYNVILEIANKRGISIEELLVESIAEKLDPFTRIELYMRLSEKYLKEAEELYQKNDLVQAGEKLWGAAATLLSAFSEKTNLPHYSHRDLKEVSLYLTRTMRDPDYTRLFSSLETLHANYYHNFLDKETFDIHKEDALRFIGKVKKLLNPWFPSF